MGTLKEKWNLSSGIGTTVVLENEKTPFTMA